jgi:glutamyl-tRNA synthetase
LSKSEIREGIKEEKFEGWDDVRLGTLRSLKRRGFAPEAIKQIIIDVGLKPSDITISMENLASYNRKIIDKRVSRYFFIANPKKIEIKDMKLKKARLPLHPEVKKGYRTFSLGKYFFIEAEDFERYRNVEIRLKDLCNVKLDTESKFTSLEVKSVPKIQWLPSKYIPVRIVMPNRIIEGYGETNLTKTKPDEVIQFERFGFVRIEKVSKKMIVAIFGHM